MHLLAALWRLAPAAVLFTLQPALASPLPLPLPQDNTQQHPSSSSQQHQQGDQGPSPIPWSVSIPTGTGYRTSTEPYSWVTTTDANGETLKTTTQEASATVTAGDAGATDTPVFSYPGVGDFWAVGGVNVARWRPYTVSVDIWLSNPTSALLAEDYMLSGSLPPGTWTFVTKDLGSAKPGDNYTIALTLAGNHAQRLAHSQLFSIRPRSAVLKTSVGRQSTLQGPAVLGSAIAAAVVGVAAALVAFG